MARSTSTDRTHQLLEVEPSTPGSGTINSWKWNHQLLEVEPSTNAGTDDRCKPEPELLGTMSGVNHKREAGTHQTHLRHT
jgi:hypothetical protein